MQLYIHLPFCKSKCRYCDFNSYAACDNATIFSYLNVLNKELRYAAKRYEKCAIDTVYIGGGTPSLLDVKYIERICKTVFDSFDMRCKEFSIEANPESITGDKLKVYRDCGIDRISIGVQSLDNNNLRSVGRLHDAETALEKLKLANEFFENVSADLIIGLPYDTPQIIENEIRALSPLVNHISMYELTLEDGTPLAHDVAQGRVLLPDDDETANLFDTALMTAKSEKFDRYEVSNFAKDGKISIHNFGYWTREEYLGIGAGAHSLIKTENGAKPLAKELRFASPRDINAYIAGINCVERFEDVPRVEMCVIDQSEADRERIMLALRTAKGVESSLLDGRIPDNLRSFFTEKDGRIALNDEGMAVMNSILIQMI